MKYLDCQLLLMLDLGFTMDYTSRAAGSCASSVHYIVHPPEFMHTNGYKQCHLSPHHSVTNGEAEGAVYNYYYLESHQDSESG